MGRAKAITILWIKGLCSLGMAPVILFGGAAMDVALAQPGGSLQTPQSEASDSALSNPNPVLLGPGANSPGVNLLQQKLAQLGLYSGPIDGNYNTATQEAVKAFQASEGLPSTGWLDNDTWEMMSTPKLLSASASAPTEEVSTLITPSPSSPPSAAPPSHSSSNEIPYPQTSVTDANASVTDVETRHRRGFRRVLGLPLAGVAIVGLGWAIKRLRSTAPASQETPDPAVPTTDPAIADGEGGGESGHAVLDSALDAILDLAADYTAPEQDASVASRGATAGDIAIGKSDASSLAVPQRVANNLPASQPEVARLATVNIVTTLVGELSNADAAVRRRAIWELGQRGNSTAIQPLVNGLREADSQEKSLIFAALAEIGNRSLQPMQHALALGLQDSSPEVRKNAIRDLSRLHDVLGQIRPLLIHATQDPDPEVQSTAQWALGQWDRATTPSLGPSAAATSYPTDPLHP